MPTVRDLVVGGEEGGFLRGALRLRHSRGGWISSMDIQDAFQRHCSSRAVQKSNLIITDVLVEKG